MRFILYLIALILLFSCEKGVCKPSTKQNLANEVRRKTALQLKKEKDLYPCGTGGQMMDEIKMLALSFDYYTPIDIKGSRELLISATNSFINEINSEKRILSFLNNYPFRPENIEIRIFIKNPDGSTVAPGNLRVISVIDGILEYDIGDPKNDLLQTIYRETYEEALQKLGNTVE